MTIKVTNFKKVVAFVCHTFFASCTCYKSKFYVFIVSDLKCLQTVNYKMLTLYIVRQSNITVALGRNADFVVSKKHESR